MEGDPTSYEEVIMDMIGAGKELGIAPSKGVDVVSSSFPSFNELRFIEPVGP